jgi:hypothetical protein
MVTGELMGPASGLAICQYAGESSFYLFSCDEDWRTLTDTLHESLEDAKAQAEFDMRASVEPGSNQTASVVLH